ncbi:hypothetical protein PR202_gb20124 [Eleusine coracana subsp. coracana]|uniref:Suppressor of white apricot N-terminal domain-containing protein n=1 Tax=Eleusine coracana subsp. coracana TaxID=191504 RepID=A0AAV5F9X9_ELECO|nr:hypothetical protein PR202_gb20124 [Eleusine coracana subsp. coracana]
MWHEARRSERKVHDIMDAARRRAAAADRAAYLARRRGDPQQAIQVSGTRCRVHRDDALYQATEDQQGLIPWNGKQDILIDRYLFLSYYRFFVSTVSDEAGLQHVVQELEAKAILPYSFEKPQSSQPPASASKGTYSQVGYSYKGDGNEESEDLNSDDEDEEEEEEEEDEDDDKDFSSDDSSDERMERNKGEALRMKHILGVEDGTSESKVAGISPPSSPIRIDIPIRSSGSQILEALHSDPASSLSVEQERGAKTLKPLASASALTKLSKGTSGGTGKTPQTEKKETPQERLKRIMSKQLNKQSDDDIVEAEVRAEAQEDMILAHDPVPDHHLALQGESVNINVISLLNSSDGELDPHKHLA